MPAINLDFGSDDYESVRTAAAHADLPLKTFARLAVLNAVEPSSPLWALATETAGRVSALSSAAQDLMTDRRRPNDEDHTWRENAIVWIHLTHRSIIVAYPTGHYTVAGHYEFLADTPSATLTLSSWYQPNLEWAAGDAQGQNNAAKSAIALGNRHLGITAPAPI